MLAPANDGQPWSPVEASFRGRLSHPQHGNFGVVLSGPGWIIPRLMLTGAMGSGLSSPGKRARFLTFPALVVVIIVQTTGQPPRPGDIVDLTAWLAGSRGLGSPSDAGIRVAARPRRDSDVFLRGLVFWASPVPIVVVSDTNHTGIILTTILDLFLVHVVLSTGGASLALSDKPRLFWHAGGSSASRTWNRRSWQTKEFLCHGDVLGIEHSNVEQKAQAPSLSWCISF